jgi:hypothetical protein
MTKMSRTGRRFAGALTLLAILPLAISGCKTACGDVGCLGGLNISFVGWFDLGKTYDITLSVLTATPEVVPIVHCSYSDPAGGGAGLLCSSASRFTASGTQLSIEDDTIKNLRVNISADGAVVGQQDYQVAFSSSEINGDGCGTCTSASLTVDFPAVPAGLVWDGHGEAVSVACTTSAGFMSFEATRAQLSADQIGLLSAVTSLDQPAAGCVTDGTACTLAVTNSAGPQRVWSARTGNGHCDGDAGAVVSLATLDPFLQALGCPYGNDVAAAAASASIADLPVLQPGQTCGTSIDTTAAGGTYRLALAVPAPAGAAANPSRHLELDNCSGSQGSSRVVAQLYDPTGTVLLASAAPLNGSSWSQVIDYAFAQAGTYILNVVVGPDTTPIQNIGVIFQ